MHLHKFRTVHSADDKITSTSRRKPNQKKVEKQRLYQFMPTYFQAQFVPANSAKLEIPSTKFEPQRVVGCFLVDWSVVCLVGLLVGSSVDWSICCSIYILVVLSSMLITRSRFVSASSCRFFPFPPPFHLFSLLFAATSRGWTRMRRRVQL